MKQSSFFPFMIGLLMIGGVSLQEWGSLSFSGITPNFLLIFFLIVPFFVLPLWERGMLYGVLFLFLLMSHQEWWGVPILVLFGISLLAFFSRKFLTGNNYVDFLMLIVFSTVIFNILIQLFYSRINFPLLLGESLYNLLVGTMIWGIFLYAKPRT